MKKLTALLLAAICCLPIAAQGPSPGQQDFTARSITFNLANPPQPVPFASVARVGNPGPATFYYWIVSNFGVGNSSPAGPFAGLLGANSFSASNGFTVSWAPVVGAVSYDVLRTTTPLSPSGACNCAVATAVTTLSVTDQSDSLNSYTVASFDPLSAAVSLQNQNGILNFSSLAASAAAMASAGSFTNTAMSFGLQSLVNGCDPQAQFHFSQGATRFGADALTGCLTVPSTSTQYQANAVTGYIINHSPNTNSVGLYSFAECDASNSFCWGSNPAVGTRAAPDSPNLHGIEVDTDLGAGTTNAVLIGVSAAGVWNAVPVSSDAFVVSVPNGSAATKWGNGFAAETGCCFQAVRLLPVATGNTQNSQVIMFDSTSSGGTDLQATISEDTTGAITIVPGGTGNLRLVSGGVSLPGGFILAADAGNSGGARLIATGTNQTISVTPSGTGTAQINSPIDAKEQAAPSGIAAFDRCYGDSTAHALKCSYNNGSFFIQSQTVATGSASLTTASIATGACGTTVTVAGTGVATTDSIEIANNAAISTPNGLLTLNKWVTAGNVNFNYCNPTASSQTPSAATINWRVIR